MLRLAGLILSMAAAGYQKMFPFPHGKPVRALSRSPLLFAATSFTEPRRR